MGEASLVSSILQEANEWLRRRGHPLWSIAELEPSAISSDVDCGRYLLAFAGMEAVGTVRLTLDDPRFWPDANVGEAVYLHRLAVRRARAGGTVSRMIVDWSSVHAQTLGCAYIRLDCDANRTRLRNLYEEFGFTFQGERTVGSYTVARFQKAVVTSGLTQQ
jgi:GNAT superfamily N-acetyltransferase